MSNSTWIVRPIDWAITKFAQSTYQGSARFEKPHATSASTTAMAVLNRMVQRNCSQTGPAGRTENDHQLRQDWRINATFNIFGAPMRGLECSRRLKPLLQDTTEQQQSVANRREQSSARYPKAWRAYAALALRFFSRVLIRSCFNGDRYST